MSSSAGLLTLAREVDLLAVTRAIFVRPGYEIEISLRLVSVLITSYDDCYNGRKIEET
jgi:hypothetical protein